VLSRLRDKLPQLFSGFVHPISRVPHDYRLTTNEDDAGILSMRALGYPPDERQAEMRRKFFRNVPQVLPKMASMQSVDAIAH